MTRNRKHYSCCGKETDSLTGLDLLGGWRPKKGQAGSQEGPVPSQVLSLTARLQGDLAALATWACMAVSHRHPGCDQGHSCHRHPWTLDMLLMPLPSQQNTPSPWFLCSAVKHHLQDEQNNFSFPLTEVFLLSPNENSEVPWLLHSHRY